jgi:hypothetical protein
MTYEEKAKAVADEAAAEMQRYLGDATTEDIAEMGWPGMTADELVASEWQCWFEEELRELRRRGGSSFREKLVPAGNLKSSAWVLEQR